jgi:enoyl-CoA hydratase/carnithine racemase
MQLQDDYFAAYRSLKLTRDASGVLVVEFHSNGGPFTFTAQDHTEFVDAFYRIAQDRANKIVILTGAGGEFIPEIDFSSFGNVADPGVWSQVHDEGVQLLENIANIRVPVIAAIEGRARPRALRVRATCQCDCGGRGCDLPRCAAHRWRHCAG